MRWRIGLCLIGVLGSVLAGCAEFMEGFNEGLYGEGGMPPEMAGQAPYMEPANPPGQQNPYAQAYANSAAQWAAWQQQMMRMQQQAWGYNPYAYNPYTNGAWGMARPQGQYPQGAQPQWQLSQAQYPRPQFPQTQLPQAQRPQGQYPQRPYTPGQPGAQTLATRPGGWGAQQPPSAQPATPVLYPRPPAPAQEPPKEKEWGQKFNQVNKLMLEGKFEQAEKLLFELYAQAEQFAAGAAPQNGAVGMAMAASQLALLYYQQRRHDKFMEWMKKAQPLKERIAALMARQANISEDQYRALNAVSDAAMLAEVHMAMREPAAAVREAKRGQELAKPYLQSNLGPAFRSASLRCELFKAWAMAWVGMSQEAKQAARAVERDLPSLRQIRFGDLLLGAIARPGALARVPQNRRAAIQSLIDAANQLGHPLIDMYARQWLCVVYFELNDNEAAYKHAAEIYRQLPEFQQGMEAFARAYDAAAQQMGQAALRLDLSNQFHTAPAKACYAKAAFRVGKFAESQRVFSEVLQDPKVRNLGDVFWECHYYMGLLMENARDPAAAAGHYVQAINAIEATRASIQSDMTKTAFLGGDRSEVYSRLIALLVDMGKPELAFAYAERAKSRAMVDMLAGRQIGRTDAERQAYDRMAMSGTRGFGGMAAAPAPPAAEPELGSLHSVNTLSLSQVQQMLPADVTLVEYYYTDDALYIWAVSRSAAACKRVAVARKALAQRVANYRKALLEGGRPPANAYKTLIEPVRQAIATKTVCIVPHGVLHYLPFAALYDGQRFLVQDLAVFRAPSATVLKLAYAKGVAGANGPMLAFGNPDLGDPKADLKFAGEEVDRIAAEQAQVRKFMRGDASETRFKAEAPGSYSMVHLACHGAFDPKAPLDSALMLAKDGQNDGRLTAIELFNLRLGARLVTLSACQTGLAEITPGDDVVGLTRGFLFAGASTIVASLWSVDDRATAMLMERFYQNLKTRSKVEALRQAQLATMQQFPSPKYWAAFTLTGDHR